MHYTYEISEIKDKSSYYSVLIDCVEVPSCLPFEFLYWKPDSPVCPNTLEFNGKFNFKDCPKEEFVEICRNLFPKLTAIGFKRCGRLFPYKDVDYASSWKITSRNNIISTIAEFEELADELVSYLNE